MATVASPLSMDQFFDLPDPENGYYELHEGEPVVMPVPSVRHSITQDNIARLLRHALSGFGYVITELPYSPTGRNYRRADVALVRRDRMAGIDPDRAFPGAPDLVVEVMSPSNKASELRALERLCLDNGSVEFWAVYPDLAAVDVHRSGGVRRSYAAGSSIPLEAFGCAEALPVDDVFAPIESRS